MKPEQPSYLSFQYENCNYRADVQTPYYAVTPPGQVQAFRLSPQEFALAELFNGERDAEARQAAAADLLGHTPDSREMRLLLHDLSEAGLLEPGTEEPLPPPAQLATALDDRYNDPDAAQGFPTSIQTGSLAGPGGEGPIVGAVAGHRGAASGPRFKLPVMLFLWLGHVFNTTLYIRLSFAPLVLTVAGLFGLWFNRVDAGIDAVQLLWLPALAGTILVSTFVVNLVSQLARAAAIAHYTGEKPGFGIGFAFGFLPRLVTATEGPAERAAPRARNRIVAAPLHATLWLFVVGLLGWFTSRHGGGMLASLWLGGCVVALVAFLIRLNPLVRRDGYFLLAHALRTPDLRDQAWVTLFGFERPWRDRPPPRKWPLRIYAAAVAAYIVLVITLILLFPAHWLENFWGGTGVLVFLALLALVIWEQSKRIRSGRGRIENYRVSMPHFPRWAWLLFVLLALLCLFPYTYSPSGTFKVLPAERADVRAVTSGVIQNVTAREGEAVSAGDVILHLDDSQQQAQLKSAKATLTKLEAELALTKAGARKEEVERAEQQVATARKRLEFSSDEADRLRRAYRKNAVSISAYQKAKGNASVEREQLAGARKQLAVVSAKARPKRLEALQAEIEAQQAQVEFFSQKLAETRIKAPIDGEIVSSRLQFARGDYLQKGEIIATVEQTDTLSAEIRMPESTISEVELGALTTARFWTYPGTNFAGHITSIAPNAETSEYGKVVRVQAALDRTGARLKPGMTGQAKIRGGVYPAIVVYTRALARFIMIEVWSWLP